MHIHKQYHPFGRDRKLLWFNSPTYTRPQTQKEITRLVNVKINWCKGCGEKSIHIFTRSASYSIAVFFSGLFEIGIGLPDSVYRFKAGGLVVVPRGQPRGQ